MGEQQAQKAQNKIRKRQKKSLSCKPIGSLPTTGTRVNSRMGLKGGGDELKRSKTEGGEGCNSKGECREGRKKVSHDRAS